MPNVPDIEGFREAQRRLVLNLGNDVTFYFPRELHYASAVYVDPESGEALDPLVSPSAITIPPSVTVKATVVNSFPAGEEQAVAKRAGIVDNSRVWLRIPEETYPSAIISARAFEVHSANYRIERMTFEGIASAVDRLYVEGELVGDISSELSAPVPSGAVVRFTPDLTEKFVAASGQTAFNVSAPYVAGSVSVFLDGMLLAEGASFDYTEGGGTLLTLLFTAMAGQVVIIKYIPL